MTVHTLRLAHYPRRREGGAAPPDRERWGALLLALVLLLAACDQGGSGTASPTPISGGANGGLILYGTLESGGKGLKPELVVSDASGKELRRITLPDPPLQISATRASNKALVRTESDKVLLVDAAEGSAQVINSGGNGSGLVLRSPQFTGANGKRWVVLGDAQLKQAYLVNLGTGQATALLPLLKGAKFALTGELSPDEEYLALFTDAYEWVGPTSDPAKGRTLGGGNNVIGASFSDDGKEVAYSRSEGGSTSVVVEGVDGSGSRVVATGDGPLRVRFAPGQNKLLLLRKDKLTSRPIDASENSGEEELLAYQEPPTTLQFVSGGSKALVGDVGDNATWQLVDISGKSARPLAALKGFFPYVASAAQEWVTFTDKQSPGSGAHFSSLDVATGDVRPTLAFSDKTLFLGQYQVSADGAYTLVTGQAGANMQLWLLRNKSADSRMLAEGSAASGTFSPDGRSIVFGYRTALTSTLTLADPENNTTKPLGEGLAPVWLQP